MYLQHRGASSKKMAYEQVAAKTSKRIQKSSFLWEKNTHPSYFVFV